jgi:hypothetical protein
MADEQQWLIDAVADVFLGMDGPTYSMSARLLEDSSVSIGIPCTDDC